MTEQNILEYSNTEGFFFFVRKHVIDEKVKEEKKIISGKSGIEKVRNEQKYILKLTLNKKK